MQTLLEKINTKIVLNEEYAFAYFCYLSNRNKERYDQVEDKIHDLVDEYCLNMARSFIKEFDTPLNTLSYRTEIYRHLKNIINSNKKSRFSKILKEELENTLEMQV